MGPESRIRQTPPTLFRVTLLFMIAAAWAACYLFPWDKIFLFRTCLFRRLTGLPCPFCDLTHSCVAFSYGRVYEALFVNPVGPILMIASVVLFAVLTLLILGKKSAFDFDAFHSEHPRLRWTIIALWTLNWIFMIWRSL